MDINFICTRKRKEFGKPCTFADVGSTLLFEIDPNIEKKDEYVALSTVDREADNSVKMCAHEINTMIYPTESRGMSHVEGGWPANVDSTDDESMARFRKKFDKDKNYVNTVKSLSDFLENFILENNSIDIYKEYFEGERIKRNTEWSVSAVSVFQDFEATYRSVIDLSWEKSSNKFAAVYEIKKNSEFPLRTCMHSYVWDVESSAKPFYILKPEVSMTAIEFSPMDSNLILGGYVSGQISIWDIRANGYAQQLSNVLSSHSEKVTGVKWLRPSEGTSVLSVSADGSFILWDNRDLSYPVEVIDLRSEESDITFSCVEYDITVPEKFMIGTQQGKILSFDRKCIENESALSAFYDCQYGPLISIERNAFYPQLFASCDPWSLKLWSEDVTDTPVLNVLSHDGFYTDITWSPTRASTMYTTKSTGVLEVWDWPGKTKEAILSVRLDNEALLSVAAAETGNHVICGTFSGAVQLLNIPEYLRSCSELEKNLVKDCVKGNSPVIGGSPRSNRIPEEDTESPSVNGTDEEDFDSSEKFEELHEESELLNEILEKLHEDFPEYSVASESYEASESNEISGNTDASENEEVLDSTEVSETAEISENSE